MMKNLKRGSTILARALPISTYTTAADTAAVASATQQTVKNCYVNYNLVVRLSSQRRVSRAALTDSPRGQDILAA